MKHTTESFARRSSGTRSQILEAAGQVFAEKGFDRATGKEIAERANTNSAAINYHFGGIERLYVAVLTEAHKSVASIEEIAAIAQSPLDPEEKLRRLIAFGIAALAEARQSWAIRVLSREFLAPTPVRLAVEDRELLPKRRLVAQVVAEALGRSEDDPVVSRCCFSVMAPVTLLFVWEAENAARAFPGCCGDEACAETLVEHLTEFALGGIRAVAALAAAQEQGTAAPGQDEPPCSSV